MFDDTSAATALPFTAPETMRPSRVLVALAAACLLSAATAEEELGELGEGSCVSSLDTGNFEAAIRGKNALVVFFAPWCGHCKALHPHFERLCADLSDQDEFLAAVVDATEEVELAQSHGVTGACLPRLAIGARAHALTECFAATGRLPDHHLVRQARVLQAVGPVDGAARERKRSYENTESVRCPVCPL